MLPGRRTFTPRTLVRGAAVAPAQAGVAVCAVLLAGLPAAHADTEARTTGTAAPATTVDAADAPAPERLAAGLHWRVTIDSGPAHVWVPESYDPATAGLVLYVHGYHTDVDRAWSEHDLAGQFSASGVNALFIVPRAPGNKHQRVRTRDIGELVRDVRLATGVDRPLGPVIAVGHSGAYRTLVSWLDDPLLEEIILLDGLYAHESRFRDWLEQAQGDHRLTLVVMDTAPAGDRWVRQLSGTSGAEILDWVPERASDMSLTARRARLLYIHSQYGHMEMVAQARVIPVLLETTRLSTLDAR